MEDAAFKLGVLYDGSGDQRVVAFVVHVLFPARFSVFHVPAAVRFRPALIYEARDFIDSGLHVCCPSGGIRKAGSRRTSACSLRTVHTGLPPSVSCPGTRPEKWLCTSSIIPAFPDQQLALERSDFLVKSRRFKRHARETLEQIVQLVVAV